MDNLTELMGNTTLNGRNEEFKQLIFSPQKDSGTTEDILDNIPRYLFRIASHLSDGNTNERWVLSESARQNKDSSKEDIFSNLDCRKRMDIAQKLNLHLRWWPKNGLDDNFVSWTSSLLFAIQYIYYRHWSTKDGSSLADIKLYVIDTAQFPRGTFIRDLDLINIFCDFEESLKNFQGLRNHPKYYFGEYISPGALKIENKCQMIPAEILFEQDRLRRIQPQFAEIHRGIRSENPGWGKEVNRLRDAIWGVTNLPIYSSVEMSNRLQAVKEIINTVACGWRLPIAIYFAALIGSESSVEGAETADDNVFFAYFRSASFNINLRNQDGFRPSNFNVIAPDTIPELKQVKKLVREIHKHSQLRRALDRVKKAELSIRGLLVQNLSQDNEDAFVATDSNIVLDHAGQSILSSLDAVQMLCKKVALAISSEEEA